MLISFFGNFLQFVPENTLEHWDSGIADDRASHCLAEIAGMCGLRITPDPKTQATIVVQPRGVAVSRFGNPHADET